MEKLRYIFTPILILALISTHATTYYFSTTDGDDNRSSTEAQNRATPWKTISKLNAFFRNLKPGDFVLFKRGDVFQGTVVPSVSGAAESPITIGSYGSSSEIPVITGMATMTGWKSIGNGIYETIVSNGLSTMNMVTRNGEIQSMGRWPKLSDNNRGYLSYQSHNGQTSISSDAIASAPNFEGGEVVIRANHYNINRGLIRSQTSTSINYSILPNSGEINTPLDNYGFFFQNHVNACTTPGEWTYGKRSLKMYFGDKPPGSYAIQGSILDSLVYISLVSYITFDSMEFRGSNFSAIKINNSHHIVFNNCRITFAGRNGIVVTRNTHDITVTNSQFIWINNNAINANTSPNWILRKNTFKEIALWPGAGVSGDQQYFVTSYIGSNSLIEYNTIDGCGYTGFHWGGDNCKIQYNNIQNFCLVKDDGAAIYTYKTNAVVPDTIQYNIVMKSPGAPGGTANGILSGGACGIYNDGWNSNIHILNNSIAYVQQYGILLNNPISETVSGNTIFAVGELYKGKEDAGTGGIGINENSQPTNPQVRNLLVTKNIIVANKNGLKCARFNTVDDDIANFGTFDHNIYARPTDQNDVIFIRQKGPSHKNIQQWQTLSKQDTHSAGTPRSITSPDKLRFEYNATAQPVRISLGRKYIDLNNIVHNGFIILAPYTSAILIEAGG